MLSILVTYYNQAEFVSRSLDSIFNQKLSEDFEVLIGDDGSQDATFQMVEEYQKKYPGKIRINIQPRDLSVKYNPVERASKNRIDLLNIAKGDFLCFLDGDDEYCDFTWMQESIDILKKDKSLVGVAHNFCEKFPDGSINTPEGISQCSYISAKVYASQYYTPAGTIIFRNSFKSSDYQKLISLKSFDDNDITFYFLNFGNLACDSKIVYTYYQHDKSIWHSANDIEKSVINAIDFEVVQNLLSKYHQQLLQKYYYALKVIYDNRNVFEDSKYDKYLNQCVKRGIVKYILTWKKTSFFNRMYVINKMVFYRLSYYELRVKSKIWKILERNK